MSNIRTSLSLVLALMLTVSWSFAQSDSDEYVEQASAKNIIKISPFHFIEGTFLMSYERMLGAGNSSLNLIAGVHSRETYFLDQPAFGFQEELQYRYYVVPPQNKPMGDRGFMYFKGLYAGPYVYHRYRSETRNSWDWVTQQDVVEKVEINEFSGGVIIGAQVAMGNKVYFDFWTGGGVKRSTGDRPLNYYPDVTALGFNGVIPKIGFMIGIGL